MNADPSIASKDRTFGEIDLLFEQKVPARKFKYTKVDRESLSLSPFQICQLELRS